MPKVLQLRMKPYIQPFERELATRELHGIAGTQPQLTGLKSSDEGIYSISTEIDAGTIASRVAYWETVSDGAAQIVSTQSLRESTVNLVRNGIALDVLRAKLPFSRDVPLPNRRCLRYGTHGIHEYRGKFFPQLVRALINISGVPVGATVADPMSGSGTTVAEAVLLGCKALGLDMNPLSVFIGRTKAQLLYANPDELERAYQELRAELMATESRGSQFTYFRSLPETDQEYLSAWFSDEVLAALDDIVGAISRLTGHDSKALAHVALSNILRSVSWQKNDDLRVRKDVRLDVDTDPKKEFLEELGRSVRAVLAFLYQDPTKMPHEFSIQEGDARQCGTLFGANSVDVIVSSPPYATALPYLDTDRLSLCYLKLLDRPAHRSRDQNMIGNREVTEGLKRDYLARYAKQKNALPPSVTAVIDKIDHLNSGTSAGFRRRNLPALLAKYFFDMTEVISGMKECLRPGCYAFVVVGDNHTIAGGQRVDIKTAMLLQDIARKIGFDVADPLPMEMLVSRDIFRTNAGSSEQIIVFRKPS